MLQPGQLLDMNASAGISIGGSVQADVGFGIDTGTQLGVSTEAGIDLQGGISISGGASLGV
jgi:hypothetical protein